MNGRTRYSLERAVSILVIFAIAVAMPVTQAYAGLQVMRRVFTTDFEGVTKRDANRLNMGIDNWFEFGGDGGAAMWMEGLDRNTPNISCHSGSRCVGMELTDITKSRRNQFDVRPVVGFGYSVSVWLYLPQDWGLHAPGINWNWYEIANPYMHTNGAPYGAVWIRQPDITQSNFNLRVGGRDPQENIFTLDQVDFALPRGRWFNLRYEVHLDAANGTMRVWVDNELVSDRTGLQTGGFQGWETVVAKIYYETTDVTPHQIWVDDLGIDNA